MKNKQAERHVFVFPARKAEVGGMRIYYLFSIRQVAEVLNNTDVHPVPFAPPHAEGVTRWRGRILPVMSLEQSLGICVPDEQMQLRTIVVRTITGHSADTLCELYAAFKVGAAIRQINLPLICEPTNVPDWVTNASVVSGVYTLKDRLYLVMNIEAVLSSVLSRGRYVS